MFMKILSFVAISIVITAGIALGLIASQRPAKLSGDAEGGLNFETAVQAGIAEMPDARGVGMRDGWQMPVRDYGAKGQAPLVILIHGSGWNGLQFSHLGRGLSSDAHVLVPDLRGHGAAAERRGDVDYIGQMEDDIADLITAHRQDGQKVFLVGHSSGGGLVTRFAGGDHSALVDEAVLLAPYLGHRSPTTRENSGGWANVLLRRIIGLSMLNTAGITALNHLTIIQFNMPQQVVDGPYGHLATLSYSYRLNTGFAPRGDYLADIAALPAFTLLAGTEDEAFFSTKYEEVMGAVTNKGHYEIVDGYDHFGIVNAPETVEHIKGLLK